MDSKRSIKKLLRDLHSKKITKEKAYRLLKDLPYENLNFARLDHHRALRKGFGEVVYCEGKRHHQVRDILGELLKRDAYPLLTRADKELYEYLKKYYPGLKYNEAGRMIYAKARTASSESVRATARVPFGSPAAGRSFFGTNAANHE